MASKQAYKRLTKEYKQIRENPPPYILCRPSEENILEWHYVITGPPGTPYENGQYHGLVIFPPDYPFRPPAIKMLTPSGRFQVNTRICLSMSDFHEDTWNPSWSVATIVTGLLSFMTSEEQTTGSVVTSERTRRQLALKSREYNLGDPRFVEIFADLAQENRTYKEPEPATTEQEKPAVLDPEDQIRARQIKAHSEQSGHGENGWGIYVLLAVVLGVVIKMAGGTSR
ncbi:hypothetical protein KL905_004163 [Ogataea polymorpha]|uniref:Ubiquitin-conjugating enzyme E2 6 n=1 Tax=Ogataea polymorpha TaxID=460523 RepID=A0A9P8NTY5_9ASCO|nr:hypothetical protein KL937_003737 [Ogataea polymorpha]KAG7903699.1 hypothetical protein KL907_003726 [Ogataea polymorpha]KAG7907313.1 hypothetical protein KL906_004000 [Ogataea polymorpha]KAG7915196.1 hypothetical protein KL927_004185 [Ogataea polymorpha]KAG7918084.1 hypothetical protein KL905_004163 [Ogataea polymorpha]